MLLCTVVSNYKQSDVDFLPLTVDYQREICSCRKVSRRIFQKRSKTERCRSINNASGRPRIASIFPKDYHAETQVMIQLMSHDEDVMPDALAGLAASSSYSIE